MRTFPRILRSSNKPHRKQVLGLDARALTVTTQTGVRTRDLMTWLGDRGYALPTYAYYIDQTIAGVRYQWLSDVERFMTAGTD